MDSSASTLALSSPLKPLDQQKPVKGCSFFSPQLLQKLDKVPTQFHWPESDLVAAVDELDAPVIDLEGFFNGDEASTQQAAKLMRAACLSHGFFQVINHGVDANIISAAVNASDEFFKLPIEEKLKALKTPEDPWGYSGAHSERFSSKLPWKETFSFQYHEDSSDPVVVEFFKAKLGKDYEEKGVIFQKYCKGMTSLGHAIMELLAISLGVDQSYYRDFFEDACSIMRSNYYPSCPEPGYTLGTGPHCDPVPLAILHQDEVGGLEVFSDNKWQSVPPRPGALVINIGDTFVALSNGKYKSCLHRALVNSDKERRSFAFFLCPRKDKIVRAPEELVQRDGAREYPEFTWSQFYSFTQAHYRSDGLTLQEFTKWLLSTKQE